MSPALALRRTHGLLVTVWYGIRDAFAAVPGVAPACEILGAAVEELTEWLLDVVWPFLVVVALLATVVVSIGFLAHVGWAAFH